MLNMIVASVCCVRLLLYHSFETSTPQDSSNLTRVEDISVTVYQNTQVLRPTTGLLWYKKSWRVEQGCSKFRSPTHAKQLQRSSWSKVLQVLHAILELIWLGTISTTHYLFCRMQTSSCGMSQELPNTHDPISFQKVPERNTAILLMYKLCSKQLYLWASLCVRTGLLLALP